MYTPFVVFLWLEWLVLRNGFQTSAIFKKNAIQTNNCKRSIIRNSPKPKLNTQANFTISIPAI